MERSSFARRQVKVSSELLSRLSIRCSAEQREELINLARQMYELPLFRERYWLHDCPKVLFRRLLSYGLSREQVLRWLPELLGLPVPGEAGFNVVRPETWADPIDFVLWDYGEPLGEGLDRSSWEAPIDNLLRMVRDGAFEARWRAAVRLAWLFDRGGLTDRQSAAFGDAL